MRLRFFAAIVTGALAQVLSLMGLLAWTGMDLLEVAVWSVFFYFAALMAVVWATEPKKDRARKHDTPQFYNLREGSDGRENAERYAGRAEEQR